jgi:hypothetical protein
MRRRRRVRLLEKKITPRKEGYASSYDGKVAETKDIPLERRGMRRRRRVGLLEKKTTPQKEG